MHSVATSGIGSMQHDSWRLQNFNNDLLGVNTRREKSSWVTGGGVGWSSGGGLDGWVFTMGGGGVDGGSKAWCEGLHH